MVNFHRSCPHCTSVKLKIQRGHPKVTMVTFNLKWLAVQEKQLFWCQSSKDSQVLSLETIVWSGPAAFYSSAYSFLLIFSSFPSCSPSSPTTGRYKCNSGKLENWRKCKSWFSNNGISDLGKRLTFVGTEPHLYSSDPNTACHIHHPFISTLDPLNFTSEGRKEIFKTEFMPKYKSIFWELGRFRSCKGM